MPEAVIGLTLGCFIANLATGAVIWDIIFGTLATLIGALGTRLLRNLPQKFFWLFPLPAVISNAVIIPFVLIFAYGVPDAYLFLMISVMIGELVCAEALGLVFYYYIKKTKLFG